MFHMDVAKVDRDVASVSEEAFVQNVSSVSDVCCKRFLSGYCICFTPMLQEFVRNVSAISVVCCNKCFHVVICKCFIWMLHMFHTYVAIVCSKYFICFRRMLLPSVSCFRGGESWGHGLGAGGWGAAIRGLAVEARSVAKILRTWRARLLVLMPALGSRPLRDRGGGVRGKDRRARRFPRASRRPDSRL